MLILCKYLYCKSSLLMAQSVIKPLQTFYALAEQLQTRVGTLNTFLLLFCECSISLQKPHPFPTRFLSLTNHRCTGGYVVTNSIKNHAHCNLYLVTLNLVTTCDLVTVLQRPFFISLIKSFDLMTLS